MPDRQCCKTRTFDRFGVDLSFVAENRLSRGKRGNARYAKSIVGFGKVVNFPVNKLTPGCDENPMANLVDRDLASGARD